MEPSWQNPRAKVGWVGQGLLCLYLEWRQINVQLLVFVAGLKQFFHIWSFTSVFISVFTQPFLPNRSRREQRRLRLETNDRGFMDFSSWQTVFQKVQILSFASICLVESRPLCFVNTCFDPNSLWWPRKNDFFEEFALYQLWYLPYTNLETFDIKENPAIDWFPSQIVFAWLQFFRLNI